jgi:hypothetical protein
VIWKEEAVSTGKNDRTGRNSKLTHFRTELEMPEIDEEMSKRLETSATQGGKRRLGQENEKEDT